MPQTRLLSKTSRSFAKSSKSLANVVHEINHRSKSLASVAHEINHRSKSLAKSFFCFHHCTRPIARSGDVLRENKGTTKKLGELLKLQDDDKDEEEGANKYDEENGAGLPEVRRCPGMVRRVKLTQKEKGPGPGAAMAMMEEEVRGRERRVKASYEALARIVEVEVMESNDLEQVSDLKEVLSNYPLIRNPLLVDLMNGFIMDVCTSILSRS